VAKEGLMVSDTKHELERIEDRLQTIEEKIGNKWILPVVVAVITSVGAIATVVVQVRLERANAEERTKLERRIQADTAHLSFYNDAITLAGRVNGCFKEACYVPGFKKGDTLNDLCGDYFALIEKHRPHYEDEKDLMKSMQEYNDLVSNSALDFEIRNPTKQEREDSFRKSNEKFLEVKKALDDFYTKHVKDHQLSEH
jgi:hypothetical protein